MSVLFKETHDVLQMGDREHNNNREMECMGVEVGISW